MKKWMFNVLSVFYMVMAIIVTLALLSYNEFGVAESKKHIFIPIKENINKVSKGSLLVIEKDDDIEEDEEVYYFSSSDKLAYGKNTDLTADTLTINGDIISYANVLGEVDDAINIWGIGYIFSLLTSKLGYLLIVIFPVLFLFLYEIYLFCVYLSSFKNKKGDNNETKIK